MKPTVFVCSFEDRETFRPVVDHWRQIEELYPMELHLLFPDSPELREALPALSSKFRITITEMIGPEFQRGRRIAAENYADSKIYVCADDDCILDQPSAIKHALEIMERHPEFAIITPMPSNAVIHRWTPDFDYQPFEDDEVMEHYNVGGIRFTRKGVMPKKAQLWWPQPEATEYGWKYDASHCEQIRRYGYRCGYFKSLTMTHLGERFPVVAEA